MKATIIDGPFRKADYNIFPTYIQVHQLQLSIETLNNIEAFMSDCDMDTWPQDIGVGKTSSQQVMNLLDLNEFKGLKNMIKERVDEYCIESGLAPVEIGKSWINSQSENGYVASHRHELSIVSGAFYPIVEPGSAPLVFDSPIKGPRMSEIHNVATHFTSDTMEFDPRDGMLILFPSWLYHYSLPNKTAKRITISFNTFHKTLDKQE
tara:strand:- start:74 stop:694 length:621 start_codon:yes stop_codon:yes gene_type:complete